MTEYTDIIERSGFRTYLGINSDLVEGPLLLSALTAALALAKQPILVGAVLVEARGWFGFLTLTALLLPYRRLSHLV